MKFTEVQWRGNSSLKQTNRSHIYQTIYQTPGVSRQDIAGALKLSLPTVIGYIQELEQEGLIEEIGYVGNTGGRNAKAYGIVERARTAIGLDITKQHITAVAVDLKGHIIFKLRFRHPFAYEDAYFRKLGEIVDQLIEEGGLERESILGVGIGLPGLVTADCNTVFYGEILHFTGATRAELAKYITLPTLLFNDANAAAFAETWENREINNAFYVMLSNNVGGAVFVHNEVYSGEERKSGEVGHITIVPGGKKCYCGQRGCVDAYCAATVLSGSTGGNLERFFALLKDGDASALAKWHTYLQHLAIAVNNLHTLFDCSIILGGYVGAYMEEYLDELRLMAARLNPFVFSGDYLIACKYKTESIAAGAALNFIFQYLQTI